MSMSWIVVNLVLLSTTNAILVETPLGHVRGIQATDRHTGDLVYKFRGIKYAKPPTGQLRFRKPEPIDIWRGEYDATKFGPICPQMEMDFFGEKYKALTQSEDCLSLNIEVPRKISKDELLPVMVYMHGGGLIFGFGDAFIGTRLALDGNVIVVTINYRLGILGFMSLYHPAAKGNYGFWDQKMAIQWIHDNIRSFGGDPNSVTITGESAGGWSVSMQSLQPSNKGLFHRLIAQSGVASRGGFLKMKTVEKFIQTIPERTNCSVTDMYQLVDCLRGVSADDLIQAYGMGLAEVPNQMTLENFFGPSIDGDFFPVHPISLLEDPGSPVSQFFGSLDFMTGTTSQEGSLIFLMPPKMQEHYNFNVSISVPAEFICEGIIRNYVNLQFKGDDSVYDAMCEFYTSDGTADEQSNRAADLLGDVYFTSFTAEMLDFHAKLKNGKTYQYQFSKISPRPFPLPPPKWLKGSGHADELLYLLNVDVAPTDIESDKDYDKLKGDDLTVAKNMISMWSSFSKTG